MSTYLLDTHAFLWLATEPERVPAAALAELQRADRLVLSVASAWEMAIKYGSGKLPLPQAPRAWLPGRAAAMGVDVVALAADHVTAVADLPLLHGDPFDRVLVAVARTEGWPVVTRDPQIVRYGVPVLWDAP